VFASALAVAVVPVVAFGGSFDTWIYRALALLIVACPCSLVISIPVAVVSAVGRAARDGVLIKGGQALEDLARVKTVAIDKTGTLTLGRPELSHVAAPGVGSDDEMLALVATVERGSEHPLARALVHAARDRGLSVGEADAFEALPGRGVLARVGGRDLWAGGPRLVAERLGAMPDEALRLEARGQTAMVLGEGGHTLAVFGLADRPRPESTEQVAASVSAQVGADEYRAGMLPEDKLCGGGGSCAAPASSTWSC
jgi:Cd2+/Zn2+-exporting ATPase